MSGGMGYHWTPCDRGPGQGTAVLVLLAVIVLAAIARPVAHAADAVGRVVVEALEITGIVLASVAGLAAIGTVGYAALRAYIGPLPGELRSNGWELCQACSVSRL